MKIKQPKKIVISRTDSIGDVALTLPLAGIIKQKYPEAKIIFLGNTYTAPIIKCSTFIDEVWEWAEIKTMSNEVQLDWLKSQNIDVFIHAFPRREIARLVQRARIPHKIGTSHRLYHLLTCNHRVNFTRKKSDLHEAQLNVKLLKPLGITEVYSLEALSKFSGFSLIPKLDGSFKEMLKSDKTSLIFHCKSKGSALEWGVDNFIKLADALPEDKFDIYFTGTEEESTYFRSKIPGKDNIFDLSGKMTLNQLIAFISKADGLLAGSTGPLHIAGLSNIHTIGLFTPTKPVHYGRWQPLGKQVKIIEEKNINKLLVIRNTTIPPTA